MEDNGINENHKTQKSEGILPSLLFLAFWGEGLKAFRICDSLRGSTAFSW